jgi:hypothetical protein
VKTSQKPNPVPAEIRARRIELLRQRIRVCDLLRPFMGKGHFLTVVWPD